MREVATDSTVLIFLGKLRKLDYLRKEYERILVPLEVYKEVVKKGREIGAKDALLTEKGVEEGWIEVKEIKPEESIAKFGLEKGETEVLSLAEELGHEEILADEESVREVARILGMKPKGTLYFLFKALKRENIDLDHYLESLEKLINFGFYIDESLYIEAVRRARKIAEGREA